MLMLLCSSKNRRS